MYDFLSDLRRALASQPICAASHATERLWSDNCFSISSPMCMDAVIKKSVKLFVDCLFSFRGSGMPLVLNKHENSTPKRELSHTYSQDFLNFPDSEKRE